MITTFYIMFRRRNVSTGMTIEGAPHVLTFSDVEKYKAKVKQLAADKDFVVESCGLASHED